ncbi:ACP S-malonyltransferase [Pendulispora rubella]|uniref:Malonyl CoA-acyl carrier protein transacylase n=1 Tax=Pendulispora rubella TaxID=2741070 RepID=A0ABZ2L190_9BACT
MTSIYVFPGQGSQRVGMGAELFESFPTEVAAANAVLGYSVEELCSDASGRLDDTEYTQPALYVVNALKYLAKASSGPRPDWTAGHSLGEYNALFAAGAFDFVTGLRLVQKRGQLMGRVQGGGMGAVVGLSEHELRGELARGGFDAMDVANLNSPTQFVLSGPLADVERAAAHLSSECDAEVRMLRVSGAFHSRYMAPAQAEFLGFVKDFAFQPLRIPVLSNAYAQPYEDGAIGETLAAQICSPVRWTEIASRFLAMDAPQIEEVGTGKTLSALFRQLRAHRMQLDTNSQEATCLS